MIECFNISKNFQNVSVLNGISLKLPSKGLVCITGDSGNGKTTLLNILSGVMTPDNGYVIFNRKNITCLSDNELSSIRLKRFGFVFQDYKLFDDNTVYNNIVLPLNCLTYLPNKTKSSYVNNLLNVVGLKAIQNKLVSSLSGGEKQRVAIARALINNPDVIFADEPTGSLDVSNTYNVFEILKTISKQTLVIVVTHDLELANEFGDQIIRLEDGKIMDSITKHNHIEDKKLLIKQLKRNYKNPALPISFALSHSLQKIKSNKGRNFACNFMISLSLVCMGLSISLANTIGDNIKRSYSELFGSNRILMSLKDTNLEKYGVSSIEQTELENLKLDYGEYFRDIGTIYLNDFSSMFINSNDFYAETNSGRYYFDNFNASLINEYKWIDEYNDVTFYPERVDSLFDDEIVLGLTYQNIQDFCYSLQIERTITSLSNYLKNNTPHLFFEIENVNWSYHRIVDFKIKGFSLEKYPCIYHSLSNFNERVFENMCNLSYTRVISGYPKYPWTLKKVSYLNLLDKPEMFLEAIFDDEDYDNYCFEIGNKSYFPSLYKYEYELNNIKRLLVFENNRIHISKRIENTLKRRLPVLDKPIYSSSGGYAYYASSILNGFTSPIYFSKDDYQLDTLVDSLTSLNEETSDISSLPDGVLNGHFSNALTSGVSLEIEDLSGYQLNQIGVSTEFAKNIFKTLDCLNKKVFYRYQTINGFIEGELEVVKIFNSNKNVIYQNSDFSILFFQCELGVSIFDLEVDTISYKLDDSVDEVSFIDSANKSFKEFDFYNPIIDLSKSVDEIVSYIRIALLSLSIITIVISLILLSTCIRLHVLENIKDISLARCLGIKKNESLKFIFSYSFITVMMSLVFAILGMLSFNLFSAFIIQRMLFSSFYLSIDIFSILFIILVSIIFSFLVPLFYIRRLLKIDPLVAINC